MDMKIHPEFSFIAGKGIWIIFLIAGYAGPVRAVEDNSFVKAELLAASDILLYNFSIQHLQSLESERNIRVEANAGRIKIDYQPPEGFLIGQVEEVVESSLGGNVQYATPLGNRTRIRLSTGYFNGFTSHRSLWIDTYYKQLFTGFDTYEESDPWSAFSEMRVQYEFLPATGILSVAGSYQYEETPTYWDVDLTGTLNKEETIARTWSLNGSAELLATPRTRVRARVWLRERTGRSTRSSFTTEALHALGDTLFLKALYGHTREGADLRANWGYLHLEKELSERHSLRLYASRYRDNGEIEDTSPSVQLTAPPASTWETGIGYRYQSGRSLRLSFTLGYFQTRYGNASGNVLSSALYAEREWLSAGCSIQFLH
ncbi:MAG: hypothetical protein ACP5I4_13585 [Oceanipulchritudo sp.]